jgi:hypothetical protein
MHGKGAILPLGESEKLPCAEQPMLMDIDIFPI